MRIAVAGSSGLIGNALVNSLRAAGHTVTRLVRREARADDEFSWDPETIGVPPESLDGVEAVVSLGGVGVGDGRWTGRFKQELRDSRITPTELLAEAVRDLGIPTFVSASATGYYGNTGGHAAVETDGPGIFRRVAFIQRVNTTGGTAPAAPGTTVGEEARVPYTAEYYFYRAAH